jgi:Holliday junction resolvase
MGNIERSKRAKSNRRRGYSLERHAVLTLLYNGFHVRRNFRSLGIEDLVATGKYSTLFVQCKDTQKKHTSMTQQQQEILKRHAEEHNAIPVFMYKAGKGQYMWKNLSIGGYMMFSKFTKEWYDERQKIKKMLKALQKKSQSECDKYVLENWDKIKECVC